jgi:hypothetical protein
VHPAIHPFSGDIVVPTLFPGRLAPRGLIGEKESVNLGTLYTGFIGWYTSILEITSFFMKFLNVPSASIPVLAFFIDRYFYTGFICGLGCINTF